MRSTPKRIFSWLTVLVLLFGPTAIVLWQHQNIANWLKLRNYHAPSEIAQLASQDTMTAYAKRMFYVNHPQVISDVSSFRKSCSESEQAIVLGCYQSGESGIYIFNPNDTRLDGVEQVTAAHEMLHAAYEQLSSKDKNYVDGMLQDYYKNDLTNPRIINEIKLYQKTEPDSVSNEMHSVFATEAANLPKPLEDYYNRYFANRMAVVAFGQKYQREFDSRQSAIDADDARLASMKVAISAKEQQLQAQLNQINADNAQLEKYRANNEVAAYNSGVDKFNSEVAAYNAAVSQLKSQITAYNQLVEERNAIAKSFATLTQELDTRLTTQAAQ